MSKEDFEQNTEPEAPESEAPVTADPEPVEEVSESTSLLKKKWFKGLVGAAAALALVGAGAAGGFALGAAHSFERDGKPGHHHHQGPQEHGPKHHEPKGHGPKHEGPQGPKPDQDRSKDPQSKDHQQPDSGPAQQQNGIHKPGDPKATTAESPESPQK
ncbi:hypothetical protein BSR29_01210 [Boudabousia liubingyangii]|uniref:Uncharacterized protein n=1 Tax=Boudabousia liubingyangii TaxID=1921764 RepID=A0A1Q5PQ13_9ACTO|nr:hypothetical protein [Boudabousia liubingyangii]OKL49606.1 hypothetical protein BSR29_01210 [Boudabousia liubingyangii]